MYTSIHMLDYVRDYHSHYIYIYIYRVVLKQCSISG